MEMSAAQSAESPYTGTREGTAFGADGFIPSELLFAFSGGRTKESIKIHKMGAEQQELFV